MEGHVPRAGAGVGVAGGGSAPELPELLVETEGRDLVHAEVGGEDEAVVGGQADHVRVRRVLPPRVLPRLWPAVVAARIAWAAPDGDAAAVLVHVQPAVSNMRNTATWASPGWLP